MLDKNLFDRAGVLNFLDVPAMYKFQIIIHIMYLAFRLSDNYSYSVFSFQNFCQEQDK